MCGGPSSTGRGFIPSTSPFNRHVSCIPPNASHSPSSTCYDQKDKRAQPGNARKAHPLSEIGAHWIQKHSHLAIMAPVYLYQKDKMALPVPLVLMMIKIPCLSLHPPSSYLSLSRFQSAKSWINAKMEGLRKKSTERNWGILEFVATRKYNTSSYRPTSHRSSGRQCPLRQ